MSHSMRRLSMASKRRREMMGERLRGAVRKATPLRSRVESKTLRRLGMRAPPKLGSMKNFCAICQLAHSRGWAGQVAADDSASSSAQGCWLQRAQVEALREREADFVGVGGDVGGVDEQHVAGLGADAADELIGELGLDDMAQLAVPACEGEVALEGRRPEVDRGLNIGAVERVVADGRECRRWRRSESGIWLPE